MIKKILSIIFISQLIVSCGFTPMLKDLGNTSNSLVYYEINPNSSYISKQILNSTLQNLDKEKANYVTQVNISEKESAVSIGSNGSVNEYKIEILVNFKIINIEDNNLMYDMQSRGFANYDVSSSEYTNSLVREEALKRALSDGIQLMNIMVQSKVNE
tara:strand:- start:167 stop:640 length:474 start_codon:yes stop_codon:yes gene_type:complete